MTAHRTKANASFCASKTSRVCKKNFCRRSSPIANPSLQEANAPRHCKKQTHHVIARSVSDEAIFFSQQPYLRLKPNRRKASVFALQKLTDCMQQKQTAPAEQKLTDCVHCRVLLHYELNTLMDCFTFGSQ